MASIEARLAAIEKRNAKVEAYKAWETSFARRGLLALFTYAAIGIYFSAIGVLNPWLNAIVPAAAFMLSTLTLPFFKRIWMERLYRGKK